MKRNQNDRGVSEVLGALLLLVIAVAAFAIVYLQFASDDGPDPQTYLNIEGEIYLENITLTHKGGESLDKSDEISFRINGTTYGPMPIEDLLDASADENSNGKWDIGERLWYPFDIDLRYLDQYAYIDVMTVDGYSNAVKFKGPVFSRYRSDVGIFVTVSNTTPYIDLDPYNECTKIYINVSVVCNGGDVAGAGNITIALPLPPGLDHLWNDSTAERPYDHTKGLWYLHNILKEDSPYNLSIQVCVNITPYHEPTQLGIIFEGSEIAAGSIPVWGNTYMQAIKFALAPEKFGIIPRDNSTELTVVKCGYDDPPHAEVVLAPTMITEANAHDTAQDFPNTPYPGGYSAISSALRLITDLMYNSTYYSPNIRQVVLIVASGRVDCIWNASSAEGYGALHVLNMSEAENDTIEAVENMSRNNPPIFDFSGGDELNAITVAKDTIYRYSTFFNNSIVMPQPQFKIYDINHPLNESGWVFECETGKDAFQEVLNPALEYILNSARLHIEIGAGSTTVDPNGSNDIFTIFIEPKII